MSAIDRRLLAHLVDLLDAPPGDVLYVTTNRDEGREFAEACKLIGRRAHVVDPRSCRLEKVRGMRLSRAIYDEVVDLPPDFLAEVKRRQVPAAEALPASRGDQ